MFEHRRFHDTLVGVPELLAMLERNAPSVRFRTKQPTGMRTGTSLV
jgi:hypothetical protein